MQQWVYMYVFLLSLCFVLNFQMTIGIVELILIRAHVVQLYLHISLLLLFFPFALIYSSFFSFVPFFPDYPFLDLQMRWSCSSTRKAASTSVSGTSTTWPKRSLRWKWWRSLWPSRAVWRIRRIFLRSVQSQCHHLARFLITIQGKVWCTVHKILVFKIPFPLLGSNSTPYHMHTYVSTYLKPQPKYLFNNTIRVVWLHALYNTELTWYCTTVRQRF